MQQIFVMFIFYAGTRFLERSQTTNRETDTGNEEVVATNKEQDAADTCQVSLRLQPA
jgi:hypothetical protein